MLKQFPLGVFKDKSQEVEKRVTRPHVFDAEGLQEKLSIPTEAARSVSGEPPEERYRNPRLIIAGFGGQGILLLGLGVAQSGMMAGHNVSWIPSYGPEMRGGTANCHVNLSSKRIGSPLVSKPSVLLCMNLPSLDKFEKQVEPGGLIVYDTSLIDRKPDRNDVEVLGIPATGLADQLGNTRVANMIMLGAYVAYTGILPVQTIIEALPIFLKRKNLVELNERAVERGVSYVDEIGARKGEQNAEGCKSSDGSQSAKRGRSGKGGQSAKGGQS
jgi:Pyruvate/2-oxoacid:ferredoxin oxidoreductase gamma subunit